MSRWLILIVCGCGALTARAAQPSLAPPADPPVPKAAPAPPVSEPAPSATPTAAAKTTDATTVPASSSSPAPFYHNESDIPDSIGALTVRPVPDPIEDEPPFMKEVRYLRDHNDSQMAVTYLQKVVTNASLPSRYRAQAILELADSLGANGQAADEMCWLKIWMQMYPARSEIGAVAYRMGTLYTRMGLSDLARDQFYLALSNAVNHGQVQGAADLEQYQRLTTGTLWALAQNEYQAGDWARAAELFDRYRHEAQSPTPASLARAEYLQADCYYQQRQNAQAATAYQQALKDHPFHPLAPEARLRLYHLDMVAKQPMQAQAELQALVWTVRTVWPKDEAYWQQRTADLLLGLNRRNASVLPPLVAKSSQLSAQDKAWQAELGHYDRLAKLEATILQSNTSSSHASSALAGTTAGLAEQDDLLAMRQAIDALAPSPIAGLNHP
jgi:outer membrane protein assembly factor BamD (BamD/ComL family)